jgi:hypothetical protein
MKKIIYISIAVLFFLFVGNASGASDSAKSTLTVHVLPAFESMEISSSYQDNVLDITASRSIAVRSNTPWTLEVQGVSNGFVNPSYCYTEGRIGLSNGQAGVGNSAQFVDIICNQEKSWGDNLNASFDIYYQSVARLQN